MYDFFAKLLMYDFFVKLLNMSLAASVIVFVIVVLRLLLKKAPKNIICILWALVALRLILPFSIQSDLSAYNMVQSSVDSQGQIEYFQYNGKTEKPKVEFNIPTLVNDNASPVRMTVSEHTSDLYLPPVISIWLAGVCVMLLYALVSYITLRETVAASIPRHERLKMSDDITAPFILGILNPVIYIPSGMDEKTLNHVIAHEEAHIKRRDHWWKPLGYFLLSVYWFNPIIWLAYVLLCRDIEMACDEKVIRELDHDDRAAYSQALLNCSFPRRRIAACPLAFGEVGVKERVKSVLNYKKPAFWIILAALLACIAVAVCFLTDPKDQNPDTSLLNYENAIPLASGQTAIKTIFYPPTSKDENGQICIGYAGGTELAQYLDRVSWQKWSAPQEGLSSPGSIEFCIRDDYRITVYQKPRWAKVTEQGEVRYYKTHGGDYEDAAALFSETPLGDLWMAEITRFSDAPEDRKRIVTDPEVLQKIADNLTVYYTEGAWSDDITKLEPEEFYRVRLNDSLTLDINLLERPDKWYMDELKNGKYVREIPVDASVTEMLSAILSQNEAETWFDCLNGDEMIWDGRREISLDEYPDVTFRWSYGMLEAVTEKEIIPLYTGMPIWSVFFCDLNGDGKRELCSTVSFGSGMIDDRIIVYDYANGESIEKSERGYYDFRFRMLDGSLVVEKRKYNEKAVLAVGELVFREGVYQILWEPEEEPTAQSAGFRSYAASVGWTDRIIELGGVQNTETFFDSKVPHCPIWKFDSAEDLRAFEAKAETLLSLDMSYDEVSSYRELAAAYDDAFFRDSTLLIIYVEASSGSFRYGVRDVTRDGETCRVRVEQLNHPEAYTCDMAGWFLLVEVRKEDVRDCTFFDAIRP